MRKIIKIGLWLLALVVLPVVVLRLALVVLFDPNDYKEDISAIFEGNTGLVLSSIGRIELDYYPWLDLRLEEVVIQGAPDYQGEPLARLRSAQLRVKLLPLLSGSVHADTVRLHGARFHLVQDAAGRPNWQPRREEGSSPRGEALAEDTLAIDTPAKDAPVFFIGGLDLREIDLQWRDESSGRRLSLSALTLSSDALEADRPISLKGDFQLQVEPGALKGKGELSATLTYTGGRVSGEGGLRFRLEDQREFVSRMQFELDPEEGLTEFREFSLQGPGGLEAGGALRWRTAPRPELNGNLRLVAKDTLELLRLAGLEQAAAAAARLPRRNLELRVEALEAQPGAGPFRISGLRTQVLGADLQADLEGRGLFTPQQLVVQGKLRLQVPDVPDLVALLAALPGLASAAPLRTLSGRLAGLRKPRDARLDVDLNMDLAAPAGILELRRLEGDFLGMRLAGMARREGANLVGRLALDTDRPGVLGVLAGNAELLQRLRSIHVEADLAGSPERIRLNPLSLRLEPKSGPDGTLKLSVQGVVQPTPLLLQIESLRAEGMGLQATGRLETKWQAGEAFPRATGELRVPEFDPSELLRTFGLASHLPGGDGVLRKLALESKFKSDGKRLEVERLQLVLDQSLLQGKADFSYSPLPRLGFSLELDRIALDPYLPPEADSPATQAQGPQEASRKLTEEQLRSLRGFVVEGDLRVGEISFRGMRLRQLQATLRGEKGRFRLEPLKAGLYEGQADIVVRADASVPEPQVHINAKLEGVQLGPLFKDLSGDPKLTGRLRAQTQLAAKGVAAAAIWQSLDGDARFRVHEGALYGVNISHRMRQWKFFSGLLKGRVALPPGERKTDFSELSASARIVKGIVSSDDLLLLSPVLRLSGQGELDLPKKMADYKISAALLNPLSSGDERPLELRGLEIPVRIHGPLQALEYGFDYKQLLTKGVVDAVSGKLLDKAGSLFGGSDGEGKQEDGARKEAKEKDKEKPVQDKLLDNLKKLF